MMNTKKKLLTLTSSVIIAILSISAPCFADSDYKFKDQYGNEIEFSESNPFFTQKNPGPWKNFKEFYKPEIKVKRRKAGLEDITYLIIAYPHHPMKDEEDELGLIQKIYVLDKDGLTIGYDPFISETKNATVEIQLNGIINYVKIYAESSKHGTWLYEFRY